MSKRERGEAAARACGRAVSSLAVQAQVPAANADKAALCEAPSEATFHREGAIVDSLRADYRWTGLMLFLL
ncbi:MAG: hypothetical protein MK135_09860 [Polyangiaceae bacterium]|nr:hypothetical protein [Polyangiaceae bacterium]